MSVYEHQSQSFAWRAADFTASADYSVALTGSDRSQLLEAIRRWDVQGRARLVHELDRSAYALDAALTAKLAAAGQVRSGRGFFVLRGLPVDGLDVEQYAMVVWGLGLHFGFALSQNAQGELITRVVDATAEDPTPRMYRSNMELRPHTDITAMIALGSWNRSQSGGATVLASGVTVHDEIRSRAPELLMPLYRDRRRPRRAGPAAGRRRYRRHGSVRCHLHRAGKPVGVLPGTR
ncbi:MAG: TauD/TfdA family dioxygenase [Lautropia sp.]